ncbi:MAG: FAD-dependent oxidoreductase [Clostridiales bacterium]|mgnify:CR=1 FL=1|jgi:hypothetical protein|nr:FAD-dependent oxidoreductase [Clostridiales bacterium]
MKKVYLEEANQLPVYDECDILIVGGGCAGHSAALAAARAGAKNIILMERYGYMGGDVTGGYVIMVPKLSWYDKVFVRGIMEEWFTRLDRIPNATLGPRLDQVGNTDPALVHQWKAIHGCVSESQPQRLVRAVYFEPNQLKIEMDKMLLEERDRIRVLYHCWGTKPIMDGSRVKGVIFESKEGRQAIFAKQVIDATGDGDIFRQTGTPYRALADSNTRSSTTALVWRIGGINWDLYNDWTRRYPEASMALYNAIGKIAGFRCAPLPTSRNDICWINNWHADRDCANIADITETEIETRNTIREVLDYLREACPIGFRNAYLYDIAPQLGSRCSYRLQGEHIMTPRDFAFAPQFDDVIAWHSTICMINDCGPIEIPYRSILPQKVENLLCPGRHISADDVAIDWLTLIPQCVGTGQAAGVAAAVAVADGTTARDVNIRKVQDILVEQNVPLPRHSGTDPSYTECCEAHEYGLYTDLAKKARAEADGLKEYRQW